MVYVRLVVKLTNVNNAYNQLNHVRNVWSVTILIMESVNFVIIFYIARIVLKWLKNAQHVSYSIILI